MRYRALVRVAVRGCAHRSVAGFADSFAQRGERSHTNKSEPRKATAARSCNNTIGNPPACSLTRAPELLCEKRGSDHCAVKQGGCVITAGRESSLNLMRWLTQLTSN